MKPIRYLAIALLLTGLTACGSNDPKSSEPLAETGDVAGFCEAAADLDATTLEGEDVTDEQLDRLVETAPAEMEDDVRVLVASAVAHREGDEEAASSDEIQSAGKRLDQFVADNCDA